MRILTVISLIICQFSAFPFIAIVAANSMRHDAEIVLANTQNVTTIYYI